jgi:hypothetical protein
MAQARLRGSEGALGSVLPLAPAPPLVRTLQLFFVLPLNCRGQTT